MPKATPKDKTEKQAIFFMVYMDKYGYRANIKHQLVKFSNNPHLDNLGGP